VIAGDLLKHFAQHPGLWEESKPRLIWIWGQRGDLESEFDNEFLSFHDIFESGREAGDLGWLVFWFSVFSLNAFRLR
jgi:hypothetical protein